MTEKLNLCKEVLENAIGVYKTCAECFDEGLSPLEVVSVQAMEELLKCRAIGTIEELQALKKKSVAKKVIEHETPHFVYWQCGNCGAEFYSGQTFCDDCGHPADWGDLLK